MTEQEIADLLLKYNDETITEEETRIFFQWLSVCSLEDFTRLLGNSPAAKKDLLLHTISDLRRQRIENALDQIEQKDNALMHIPDGISRDAVYAEVPGAVIKNLSFLRRWRWVAASAILLVVSYSVVWFGSQNKQRTTNAVVQQHASENILPGHDGAILTLSDGRQVILDSLGNGSVASENGSRAVLTDGQLVYQASGNITEGTAFHVMSTPNGRQFKLILPDGTNVWLNAASSIRYPVAFTGSERRVEVTGEAYFEVTENAKNPFIVSVNKKMEIVVTGTHFNVNSYDDETIIRTTLLEGSVKIKKNEKSTILSPGMQALVNNQTSQDQEIQVVKNADVDMVMAWKNGFFSFRQTDIATVMRQISRWYDLEIVYAGKIPDRKFGGSISRKDKLQEVLKMMEEMKIRYRIEGKKIIIMD